MRTLGGVFGDNSVSTSDSSGDSADEVVPTIDSAQLIALCSHFSTGNPVGTDPSGTASTATGSPGANLEDEDERAANALVATAQKAAADFTLKAFKIIMMRGRPLSFYEQACQETSSALVELGALLVLGAAEHPFSAQLGTVFSLVDEATLFVMSAKWFEPEKLWNERSLTECDRKLEYYYDNMCEPGLVYVNPDAKAARLSPRYASSKDVRAVRSDDSPETLSKRRVKLINEIKSIDYQISDHQVRALDLIQQAQRILQDSEDSLVEFLGRFTEIS